MNDTSWNDKWLARDKKVADQFSNNNMPGKFIMSVKINGVWRLESGTDSLTELDVQLQVAVKENGPDNVKLYVMVEIPLEPESRDEELEDHGVIPGNYRPGCPSPDRHIVDNHPDHPRHWRGGVADDFMLSHYPDLIKEYGNKQPTRSENPWRGIVGHPLNDEGK